MLFICGQVGYSDYMSDQIKIFVPSEAIEAAVSLAVARFDVAADIVVGDQEATICVQQGEKSFVNDLPCRLGGVIDAVIRFQSIASGKKAVKISFSGWDLEADTLLLVSHVDGQSVKLTEKEAALLGILHEKRGVPVSRDDLLRDVWGYVEGLDTHTLETHIYRLRQKIELDPAKPEILVTDDEGYILKA